MPRDRKTEDAQDLFTRGHDAFNAGDHREAIECFSRAITLRPDVALAYRFRAYAYLELGDRVRALNDLDHAIRLKPDDPQAYADRAAELYAQKAFDLAIADCDRVLKLDPGRAPMYGLRGRAHAERGDTDGALRDYATALANDPENRARYLLWRAQLLLDCEDYAAAQADATAVAAADPTNAEAHFTRGTIAQQEGDHATAAEAYTACLALKSDHPFALLGRAHCHFVHRDYGAVVADCDRVVALVPGVVKAYELRGTARKALGDLDGALADFNEAIRLAPSSVMPYNYRAGLHYARRDYAGAVRDHMEALKRDPRHAGTFNQLAWVWSTCPDPDVRNGQRARECATRACELTEWAEPGFLDTLAAAHAECGDFDDAVKWQEKAMGLLGGDPDREADYRSRLDRYLAHKPARVTGGPNV
ncbi:tpr repeat-containing protein : TPR repeat-containing protein OS=Pedosphaera parvula (strain Ellin514) GN=Cflav_PD3636 PE=4 SV=1: TPR_11: TPR_16: TPR_11: TPR_11 [Gemmataceae bacterium]|nr:tpr repeat-containing protein : TPR repeat-containing protein OS=Pedosphaera parvula (strain Ellin514) GN=Cflav_PD3636 PE=4 SV=1: TPR_11: TPR_16: TPR_11: TPR_11 [Gemmataceae bacterium]VTT99114.1 tpr repeat-containing protein : TPR repeat-containing protein OS=Pedosphaera parvula (strain Ellin514) GN=Cflav_PD3636 PE=4 SV=1: TPR_11: TPR_16: TPR_11: TPR_11 [Gemmataceae bacterium]